MLDADLLIAFISKFDDDADVAGLLDQLWIDGA